MRNVKNVFSMLLIAGLVTFGVTGCGGGDDAGETTSEPAGESTSSPGTAEKLRSSIIDKTSEAAANTKEMAGDAAEATKEMAGDAAKATKEMATEVTEAASDKIGAAKSTVADAMQSAGDAIEGKIAQPSMSDVEQAADTTKESLKQ